MTQLRRALVVFCCLLSVSATSFAREMLKEGDEAPDFTLKSATGEQVSLASYRGKKTVVLYFYPKDFTPVCTDEAKAFTADYDKLEKAGAVVLGVSVDDVASHKAFANKNQLKHALLADYQGRVAADYGVMGVIMAKRVTFVIDTKGIVRKVMTEFEKIENHPKEVLKVVQEFATTKY